MTREEFAGEKELDERVVNIARVAKVVRGGRHFSFRTVVVVGDHKGQVGVGVGKAGDVAGSIQKGLARARNNMVRVPMLGTTIPHEVRSSYGATKILLKPAAPGTGVLAGGAVRAVLEACGIGDVLTKSLGSANVLNMVRATMQALGQLKDLEEEARRRGKTVPELGYRWLARRD